MRNRLPLLALLLAPVLAHADDQERPAAFPRGEETCFGRVYDAEHLKAHPDQTVTSFLLWHELTEDPLVESGDETSAGKREWDNDADNPLLLNLMMHVRDRPDQQVQQFECTGGNDSIFCGVDCDGGYFTAKADGDKLTVTNEGFQFEGVCESGFGWLDPGKDDKVFALDKMPASACAAERERARPSLAEAGPPLSTALDGPDPACYEASYDDTHLAANAAQSVTDIWLLKSGEDGFHLGVCQRGGDCAEAEVACSPNTYSWACIGPNSTDVETFGGNTERRFPSPAAVLTRAGKDTMLLRNHLNHMAKLLDVKFGAGDDAFKLTLSKPDACKLMQ